MAGRTFKVAGRDILVDVGHANQWLVQFLYILGVQFDGELVTGEYGLSGGGDVLPALSDEIRKGSDMSSHRQFLCL